MMMTQRIEPSFSVIIPTFGRAKLLSRAIASVLTQSYPAHEIIVVDDGSIPPIGEDIKRLAENVQLIRLPFNSGVGVARNAGMLAAQGEYIALLDSDDTWEPHRLKLAKDKIIRAPCIEKHFFFDNLVVGGELICPPPTVIDNPRTLADSLVLSKFLIPTPSLIFHNERHNSLQFDPALRRHEDWDLLISAVAQGFKLVNLETNQVSVHGGLRSRLSTQRDVRSAARFLERNSAYLSPAAIKCFVDLNIRSPQERRLEYISMLVARFADKQVSRGGLLGRLLMTTGFRQAAD